MFENFKLWVQIDHAVYAPQTLTNKQRCLKFTPKSLCDVIWGSDLKTSDLAAHFSRNPGAANTVLFTIQTFNEHSRMAKLSQPYLRGNMR